MGRLSRAGWAHDMHVQSSRAVANAARARSRGGLTVADPLTRLLSHGETKT